VCSSCEAVGASHIALLDDQLLLAARACPRLLAGLLLHLDQQNQRLATQVMICQLQRVEDRVLAMMWLLADSWGRVTPAGTLLAIRLTHQALGELVGARRPTVTLALKQLVDRGALRRQKLGWLLIERPSPALDKVRIGPASSTLSATVVNSLQEAAVRAHRVIAGANES
jgi:CRP-like cAMP-binding protein